MAKSPIYRTNKKQSVFFAMSLVWKKNQNSHTYYTFNDTQVRATLVGLSCVYHEALIWRSQSQILVLVVGQDVDLLSLAFRHLENHAEDIKIFQGDKSTQLFSNILCGVEWPEVATAEKLHQLNIARSLAEETGSLGNTLTPVIDLGVSILSHTPEVMSLTNGWHKTLRTRNFNSIEFPPFFYRYSIN